MSFLENMAVRTILRILPSPGARSRAEGDGRSDAYQCCDMKADLATIGPEATLKAHRCVGPTRAGRLRPGGDWQVWSRSSSRQGRHLTTRVTRRPRDANPRK